jgi:hypothetical protein
LGAIVYYAKNLKSFVLWQINLTETVLQKILNDLDEMKMLKTDLAYIHANLSFLSPFVTTLAKTTNLLSETITEIKELQDKLYKINGSEADAVKENLLMFQ